MTPTDPASDSDQPTIDIVMPVYNEAASIAATVAEWLSAVERIGWRARVILSEDGSTDGTRAVCEGLAGPVVVVGGGDRQGYSQAVCTGIGATTSAWVCCVDSDGQCDPDDLAALLERRAEDRIVIGVRQPRIDARVRIAMSGVMKVLVRAAFDVRLVDPSCPYVVLSGPLARDIATSAPFLPAGYWWEFHARARHRRLPVTEVPVHHRPRLEGGTRVYRPWRMPRIVAVHLVGLWRLHRALGPLTDA